MDEVILTPEQEAEAERIEDILKAGATVEIRQVARLLASRSNRELLGETEFRLRDAMHRLGARGIDAALAERKKRGTKRPVASAHTARKTRGSKDTGSAR